MSWGIWLSHGPMSDQSVWDCGKALDDSEGWRPLDSPQPQDCQVTNATTFL